MDMLFSFIHDISNKSLQHLLIPMAHCPPSRQPMPLPLCREGQEVVWKLELSVVDFLQGASPEG